MEKKHIYFIVNGTESTVEVNSELTALDAALTALSQVGEFGRSIDEYQIISNDKFLDWRKPILEQVVEEGVVFLSLKSGVGGSEENKTAPSPFSPQVPRSRTPTPPPAIHAARNETIDECINAVIVLGGIKYFSDENAKLVLVDVMQKLQELQEK